MTGESCLGCLRFWNLVQIPEFLYVPIISLPILGLGLEYPARTNLSGFLLLVTIRDLFRKSQEFIEEMVTSIGLE